MRVSDQSARKKLRQNHAPGRGDPRLNFLSMGFLITRTAKCAESRGGRLCDAGLEAQIERKLRQKGRPRKPSQFSLKGLWGPVCHRSSPFFRPSRPVNSWRRIVRTPLFVEGTLALLRASTPKTPREPSPATHTGQPSQLGRARICCGVAMSPTRSRYPRGRPRRPQTASCPIARGQPVHADPFGPQIIPRSR